MSTVLDGATTNGTLYIDGGYDPTAPVPYWHRHMLLATIIVCNSLSFIVMSFRFWYRRRQLGRFRKDDAWMLAAGIFLICYTVSQLGGYVYGSGLHMYNVPEDSDWLEGHWHYAPGWAAYYITASCIKISVCVCVLQILPQYLRLLRYGIYGLLGLVLALGITMTFAWLFECTPFISNFDWNVESDSCINYDYLRWLWIGLGVPIDIAISVIPLRILQLAQLQNHEKKILKLVFAANLLGTVALLVGIAGVYATRVTETWDSFYNEVLFLMLSDIEILMYTLGASFPVLSKYLIAKTGPVSANATANSNFSSWARRAPNLFSSTKAHGSRSTTVPRDIEAFSYERSTSISNTESSLRKEPEYELNSITQSSASSYGRSRRSDNIKPDCKDSSWFDDVLTRDNSVGPSEPDSLHHTRTGRPF